MSKGDQTETDVLAKIFKNTALPWDAITDIYLSLHSADPGEAGDQTTNEISYTGYARVAVSRSGTGWTVAGGQATNAALVQFGLCTLGSATAAYVVAGTLVAGAGQILYSGQLSSNLSISVGIQPQFAIGALTITED